MSMIDGRRRRFRKFLKIGVGLGLALLLISCTAEVDLGPDFVVPPGSGDDTSSDGEFDSASDPYYDTEMGPYECPGQFLTLVGCHEAYGTVDPLLAEPVCIDKERRYCCLGDTLARPCLHDCITRSDCNLRGEWAGDTDPVVVTGPNAQCPREDLVCCGAAALPVEPDTGELFQPANCPIPPQDLVTPAQQPNVLAARICTQYLREQELLALQDTDSDTGTGGFDTDWWFCPQPLYDRIDRDLGALLEEYPVMTQAHPQFAEGFDRLFCEAGVACVDFPRDWFDGLAVCFGDFTVDCRYPEQQTCGESHLYFEQSLNIWRARSWIEDHARVASADSVCSLDEQPVSDPPAGYRFEPLFDSDGDPLNDWWQWTMRVFTQCQSSYGGCDCDFTFEAFTAMDGSKPVSHGLKIINEEFGGNSLDCTDTAFIGDTH